MVRSLLWLLLWINLVTYTALSMDEDLFDPRIPIGEPGSTRWPRALTWGASRPVRIQRSARLFAYETVWQRFALSSRMTTRKGLGRLHIVDVEYLDDCRYPEAEQLLWEVEATAQVLGKTSLAERGRQPARQSRLHCKRSSTPTAGPG